MRRSFCESNNVSESIETALRPPRAATASMGTCATIAGGFSMLCIALVVDFAKQSMGMGSIFSKGGNIHKRSDSLATMALKFWCNLLAREASFGILKKVFPSPCPTQRDDSDRSIFTAQIPVGSSQWQSGTLEDKDYRRISWEELGRQI